ncbi:MAG: hypothetical protein LC641_03000 [Spirochaeta sp.]|nr:hypothetical protein [Spirochaeta sp.]
MPTGSHTTPYARLVWAIAALVLFAAPLSAQNMFELRAELDMKHENDEHQSIVAEIEAAMNQASRGEERAELYWRHARAKLNITDLGRFTGTVSDDQALELLEEAEGLADQAISADPRLAPPYFWKAAAIAQRGQIRGVLNSLFMAGDVRDAALEALERDAERSEVHYLLGQLYRELPGRPLSFGNGAYAVSFGRMAVDLHEQRYNSGELPNRYYDYYTQLAASLRARNWNSGRRSSRAESMRLASESDRQEGRGILDWVISELQQKSSLSVRQQRSLEDAQELANERW